MDDVTETNVTVHTSHGTITDLVAIFNRDDGGENFVSIRIGPNLDMLNFSPEVCDDLVERFRRAAELLRAANS